MLFVKVVFTIVVLFVFYDEVKKISLIDIHNISIKNPIPFIIGVLFAFINQLFEFQKWKAILLIINESTDKIQSYLAGFLTGFLTPNLIGNFIGRMYYYPRQKRTKIIALTLLSNGSQFIASIYFGLISLAWLGQNQLYINSLNKIVVSLLIAGILLSYFLFDKIPLPIKFWKSNVIPLLKNTNDFRIRVLWLSILRYLVFSLQYILFFQAFGIQFSFDLIGWIWQIYFWSTLAPSLWMGKLFIRESIALWVLLPVIGHPEIILITSISIWIINQGMVALIAIPFIKKQVL